MSKIQQILQDSNYKLGMFSDAEIAAWEAGVVEKHEKGKTVFYVSCLIRNKSIQLKPEEVVRQLYLNRLLKTYGYSRNRIQVEYPVQFGSDNSKRADIVIFDKDNPTIAYIVIELKKPNAKDGKDQLKSYCNGTGAPIGVWTNGQLYNCYQRKDPNIFEEIREIPNAQQTLKDLLNERFTILDLMLKDKLKAKSLKRIIEEFEDEVLANAGVDVFEEAFKLIFTKLYDESLRNRDKNKIMNWQEDNPDLTLKDFPTKISDTFENLRFQSTGVERDTKMQIDHLFNDAKRKWKGIFQEDARVELPPAHLQTCVSYLQEVKLFNSNLEVIDEAFEYLVNKDAKGDKGQYFTPRYIIDMCVKMLNPKVHEFMMDTAAGSCGFPVHTIFHVWNQLNPYQAAMFSAAEKTPQQIEYVQQKVFAMDFDLKAVRVGRTLNLIAGDGETNVLELNSLDYERWQVDYPAKPYWNKHFRQGFENLADLRTHRTNDPKSFQHFEFDVLMANPPFAGDIKDQRLIRRYELARKTDGQGRDKGWQDKISRDILFLERNLDMLKAGGRMAIVLPQGRFNNQSDKALRQFIAEQARILAVIGLHGNSFKPHTGTKTSVLLVQKWHPTDCPKREDYPIFFATQQLEGKNNSGDKLFWKPDLSGTTTNPDLALKDNFEHPIIYHDLYNTDGKTHDGITEAFWQFAYKEHFSFF